MAVLEFTVQSLQGKRGVPSSLEFHVKQMVNGGYTARDQEAIRRHIEELEREGIAPPPRIPMLFPVLADRIAYGESMEVLHGETSGEAEYVLLLTGDTIYVAVGSDHTDRALERADMTASKQVYPNMISREIWPLGEVADHWEDLVLCSYLDREKTRIHQRSSLAAILDPRELLELVRDHVPGSLEGTVVYSGTIPSLAGNLGFSDYFLTELVDEKLGRVLTCGYEVKTTNWFHT